MLDREGERIRVYELRGDLSFGSAERLVRRVISDMDRAGWIVLDFRRAAGIDDAAWDMLVRLDARARAAGIRLIASYRGPAPKELETAHTTDEALERCEADLLDSVLGHRAHPVVPLAEQPLLEGVPPDVVAALEDAAAGVALTAGEVVFREGDAADAVYFIESGMLRAEVQVDQGRTRRLMTMGPGVAFGELALIDAGQRSATVVSEGDATVRVLPFDVLRRVERDHAGVTTTLYRNVARLLSQRLRTATDQVRMLDR